MCLVTFMVGFGLNSGWAALGIPEFVTENLTSLYELFSQQSCLSCRGRKMGTRSNPENTGLSIQVPHQLNSCQTMPILD